MKKLMFGLLAVVVSVALYAIPAERVGSAQTPDCERPACRSGDKYSRRRHRCESTSGLNWRSHYAASCPAGYHVDEARGVCVRDDGCCRKRACRSGFMFRDGKCYSRPGDPRHPLPYVPDCGTGWELNASNGTCHTPGCVGGSEPQGTGPRIDRLGPTPCVDRGGTANIYGSGFGPVQGDRLVQLGGHGIGIFLRVTSWSDTEITAIVPNDPRIEFSQWYYIGLQDRNRHWISNISRTINICREFG